jgi:hypothetical protein
MTHQKNAQAIVASWVTTRSDCRRPGDGQV